MKSLHRLSSTVWNTPQYITPTGFDSVLNYLEARNGWSAELSNVQAMQPTNNSEAEPNEVGEAKLKLAVIQIRNTLTYRPYQAMCEEPSTSYQSILAQVEAAIEANIKKIAFIVASPGGEASHCFEYADRVREMCDEAGVTIIAYADEYACSAAYAWTVIADEVYANPTSTIGSIGCVVSMLDTSKAMDKAGMKRIFVTSGANKVPYDEDGSFKKEFIDKIQALVDKANDNFTAFVSKYTGLDSDVIRGFEADTFDAETSLSNGLINGIMTVHEFNEYLESLIGDNENEAGETE